MKSLSLRLLIVPVLAASMIGCQNLSSVQPQLSQEDDALRVIQREVSKQETDSFYLVKCVWPKAFDTETPQDSLLQLEEVMSRYEDCYVRHNGWVETQQ